LAETTPMPMSEQQRSSMGGSLQPPAKMPRQPRSLAALGVHPPVSGVPLPAYPLGPVRHGPVKLSILMPAYNEERTVAWVVDEILRADYPCDFELIIVDDGSTDRTPALLANIDDPRLQVLRHSVNRGKGAALLSAAALATGTHVLPFDADFEYEPADIPRLLEPMLRGRCEVVYGVRLFGCNTVYQSYKYAVGNRLLTRFANILFNSYLSDLHTCLKLVPLSMFRMLKPSETGFGLDTEITALLLRHGIRPFEVPVSYYSRSHAQGKKITSRDALQCLWILLRERVARRKYPDGIASAAEDPALLHGGVGALRSGFRAFSASDDDDDELAAAAP
jgi:glycosyltransferase involved in cell wall biosynthesis